MVVAGLHFNGDFACLGLPREIDRHGSCEQDSLGATADPGGYPTEADDAQSDVDACRVDKALRGSLASLLARRFPLSAMVQERPPPRQQTLRLPKSRMAMGVLAAY